MTAAIYYLAEVRHDSADSPELRVFDAGQLAGFLARNIENDLYLGYAYEIVRLFRYDGGPLAPLTVHQTGTGRDPEDWLDWRYEVRGADTTHGNGGHVAEVAFTVRIGRKDLTWPPR
jgi:hypothetical protein